MVPLPKTVANMIPTALDPDALVFPAPGGGCIRHGNWRARVFDQAVKAAGLEDLHPHELRHTAASLAIAQGANVKAVSAMLGHARASITLDRYGHLYPADTAPLTGALDRMLAQVAGEIA